MFETHYTPTDADLLDWLHVLKLNEAEDFGPSDEMLINWQEENDYRDSSYPEDYTEDEWARDNGAVADDYYEFNDMDEGWG